MIRNRLILTKVRWVLLVALCVAGLLLELYLFRPSSVTPAPLVSLTGSLVKGLPESDEQTAVRISAVKGTPIYALTDGVLSYEGEMGMLYSLSFPTHKARILLVGSHISISLADNQNFKQGDIIGYIADDGLLRSDIKIGFNVFGEGAPTEYLQLSPSVGDPLTS